MIHPTSTLRGMVISLLQVIGVLTIRIWNYCYYWVGNHSHRMKKADVSPLILCLQVLEKATFLQNYLYTNLWQLENMNWATFQNPYDIPKKTRIIIIPLYTANNQRSLVTPTPRFSSIPVYPRHRLSASSGPTPRKPNFLVIPGVRSTFRNSQKSNSPL